MKENIIIISIEGKKKTKNKTKQEKQGTHIDLTFIDVSVTAA